MTHPDFPGLHVRSAPYQADLYPYYAALAAEDRLIRDDGNGWWVAASARVVEEGLLSPICHTRPREGRVPAALGEGALARIYGGRVRQRDDETSDRLRGALLAALTSLDAHDVAAATRARAEELAHEIGSPVDAAFVTRFIYALPTQTIARLLGVADAHLAALPDRLKAYGAAISAAGTGVPAPSPALFETGEEAATALWAMIGDLLDTPDRHGPLLAALVREAAARECAEREDLIANAIGYLFQGFVGPAALIGLTLVHLHRNPLERARLADDPARLRAVIQETLRYDASTSSTVRFVVEDGVIDGTPVATGDVIMVVIGAAGRDPKLNPHPDVFDADRADRRYFEFGAGRHACPARDIAPVIAEAGAAFLLERGAPLAELEATLVFPPSPHIRAPRFEP